MLMPTEDLIPHLEARETQAEKWTGPQLDTNALALVYRTSHRSIPDPKKAQEVHDDLEKTLPEHVTPNIGKRENVS